MEPPHPDPPATSDSLASGEGPLPHRHPSKSSSGDAHSILCSSCTPAVRSTSRTFTRTSGSLFAVQWLLTGFRASCWTDVLHSEPGSICRPSRGHLPTSEGVAFEERCRLSHGHSKPCSHESCSTPQDCTTTSAGPLIPRRFCERGWMNTAVTVPFLAGSGL